MNANINNIWLTFVAKVRYINYIQPILLIYQYYDCERRLP